MAEVSLDLHETEALISLATPLVLKDTPLQKAFKILSKVKLSIILWVDIVSHITAIVNRTEDGIEGGLTIGAFICSNAFIFPLIRISTAEASVFNAFLLLFGLYDLKRYLDRGNNDRFLREFINPYVTGRELLNTRIIQSVYCMKSDEALDNTIKYRREIITTLPLLVVKVYFACITTSHCSYISVLRILVIVVGLYEPISACVQQETSLYEMLKAGNLYSVGMLPNVAFNPRIATKFTPIFAYISVAVSTVYRVYAIVFYTFIHPLAGVCQLSFALLGSAIFHFTKRPVYENPPIAAANFSYNFVEVISKLFVLRYSRLYPSKLPFQFGLWTFWTLLLVAEHVISLYIVHWFWGHGGTSHIASSDSTSCYEWIEATTSWLSGIVGPSHYLAGDGSLLDNLEGTMPLTLTLTISILVNAAHLMYLEITNLNDAKFPEIAAYNIWSEVLFALTEKWHSRQRNSAQIEWLQKMMVLTLLSPEEFERRLPCVLSFCGLRPFINWKELAEKKAGDGAAPNVDDVLWAIQQTQTMADKLVDFVQYVYSINRGTDETLKKLAANLCLNFDSQIKEMTSKRIEVTCALLRVSPEIVSPFKQ